MTDLVLGLGRNLGESFLEASGLEDRVPTEHVFTAGWNDCAIASTAKDDRVGLGSRTKGENTLRVGCLVLEVLDHLPETFTSHITQEVLNVRTR